MLEVHEVHGVRMTGYLAHCEDHDPLALAASNPMRYSQHKSCYYWNSPNSPSSKPISSIDPGAGTGIFIC